jgi:hypothetical protein
VRPVVHLVDFGPQLGDFSPQSSDLYIVHEPVISSHRLMG